MKNVLLLLSVLLIGCTAYQPITSTDPIYGYTTNTVENEFELQRLLRTDFNFRYDFAQIAKRQPLTWQLSNRISPYRFNRYNYWNPYSPMDYTQAWDDWLWGFNGWNSWGSPHRWSPFGYDRWGYGIHYGWNNHGWGYNGYYGNSWYWRTQMNRFAWQNRNRTNNVTPTNNRPRTIRNSETRVRTNVRTNTKPNDDIRTLYPSGFINSNPKTRPNNVKPKVNNRPVINRNSTPRIIKSSTPKRRGN